MGDIGQKHEDGPLDGAGRLLTTPERHLPLDATNLTATLNAAQLVGGALGAG
jgi:hypothetical protein